MDKVNVTAEFGHVDKLWTQRTLADLNGQQVKIAKLKGEFQWHKHDAEDEMFWVVKGSLVIRLREKDQNVRDIELSENEFFVIPRGVEHMPVANEECWVMLFEPAETVREGD